MNKVFSIVCGGLLLFGISAATLSMSGCGEESSSQMKQAGQAASEAVEHTGKAIKSAVNKGAKKVEKSTD